ncbi:MAG: Nucleoside triphosphate pyrophosphohydrolase/pyrophosphatase MazG [Chlamydiales bacterium]|nr:Nucleoside triphosphate pyrophosphohydrolase/pyrophosphatase MazG [Chlamydiales bacterium]MCH9620496.1 Nucleoside triphosphate pyrophosphohydrolase/pyrophosphatase MazG [Chlamydiales bacterium]MCH9623481.1 Nucleoside triphosphate pyrophosphohydrolase/pyrophosphatase MazG [Chlamydiales bacterium]
MCPKEAVALFEQLLEVTDRLMGPDGCPWDRKQTYESIRGSILEEVYEIIEAIDQKDIPNLVEELGDLFFNVIFLAKLGEREGQFEIYDSIKAIYDKLILRHPHVFGDVKAQGVEHVIEQWEMIKRKEKADRKSVLDGIPLPMPALARACKVAKKMGCEGEASFENEEALGEELWKIVLKARTSKLDPELALRKLLMEKESNFRKNETAGL